MAARRLVIVMVVLLGLSTLAAALVPTPDPPPEPPPARADKPRERSGNGASGYAPLGGGVVNARLAISNRRQPPVRVRPGDQLLLAVHGPVGDDIEIPAFGLTEAMTPYAAARFDILIDRSGRFAVRAVEAGRVVGTIVASPCVRTGARGDGSKAPGCGPPGAPGGQGSSRSAQPTSDAEGRPRPSAESRQAP